MESRVLSLSYIDDATIVEVSFLQDSIADRLSRCLFCCLDSRQ